MIFRYDNIPELLLTLVVFVFSITIHEMSHGYMANKLGDPTARNLGRLTLNPLAHLDLVGTLLILFAPFGYAKPVPINTRYFRRPGRDMALVSFAGPISNLIVAFITMLIYNKLIFPLGLNQAIGDNFASALFLFFQKMVIVNVSLGVFNLLPIPPLDGSKILLSLVPYNIRSFIFSIEQYGFILLFVVIYALSPFITWLSMQILTGMSSIINLLPF